MIQLITPLLLIRKYIKEKYANLDYHSIYRSLFCLIISMYSSFIIYFNWDSFVQNPLITSYSSYLINISMLMYMIIDLGWMVINNKYRIDLFLHHILCLFVYLYYYDYMILTYYAINECLSAFNWISLIYPNYEIN